MMTYSRIFQATDVGNRLDVGEAGAMLPEFARRSGGMSYPKALRREGGEKPSPYSLSPRRFLDLEQPCGSRLQDLR